MHIRRHYNDNNITGITTRLKSSSTSLSAKASKPRQSVPQWAIRDFRNCRKASRHDPHSVWPDVCANCSGLTDRIWNPSGFVSTPYTAIWRFNMGHTKSRMVMLSWLIINRWHLSPSFWPLTLWSRKQDLKSYINLYAINVSHGQLIAPFPP